MSELDEAVKRIVNPIARRVLNSLARSIIKKASEDGLQIQVLADELRDDTPCFQQFGFKSVPVKDGEAVVIFLGGNRGAPVVVATKDKNYEPTGMSEGETCVWDKLGQYVYFKKDGTIAVKANKSVDVDAPKVTMTGDLEVSGKVTAKGVVQGSEVQTTAGTKLSTHMHPTAVPGPPSPPTPGT